MAEPPKLPQPADKPIQAVMEEFLAEQQHRLKPATLRQYESVIQLFTACMDGYAYSALDEGETRLYERLSRATGAQHRDFCQIFGPEKIADSVGEFLDYFMIRKVMCGEGLLRAAGTVMKKLGKWLCQKGYVATDEAEFMSEEGQTAARKLPAVAELRQLFEAHLDYLDAEDDEAERIEGYFRVEAVEPGNLLLSALSARDDGIEVPVPRAVSDACQEGWTLSGVVGKTGQGWRLLQVSNVYP